MLDIQALTWGMQSNVAWLKWSIWFKPTLVDDWICNSKTDINKLKKKLYGFDFTQIVYIAL
jgi:hypothetical protein